MNPDRPAPPADRPIEPPRSDDAPFPAAPGHDFAVRRRTLIALLVAAIVLPCVYVAAMAYSDLSTREADATDATLRTVRVAEEHALKVFDMNEALDARIVDLVQGLDDEGIRANEAEIHAKLDAIGGGYPQIASVSIFGSDGDLLTSSRFALVPPVSISQRDDFVGIRDGRVIDHVSRVMYGKVSGETVFNMGVARRDEQGAFAGIVSVALRPGYFSSFYRDLLGAASPMAMGLIRSDGAILAYYPTRASSPDTIDAKSPFGLALARGSEAGVVRIHSPVADDNLILAYRRVGSYPVYVSCGYRTSAIWAAWYRHLTVLLLSMFTPSIALWAVIWLSLRRLAAEEEAWERWQAEASMRRSIESAYRQSRKMEALGNLVGSVAHDFNNLLMIVSANVQIARRRGAAGFERELSAMERALKSGQSLTRQLLGVARKQPLRNETIHVGRWLPACRELLRASLGAKVSLVIDVNDDVWPILVDVAELELALINLAVNARDAMPNGGRFTVRARNIGFRPGEGFPLDGDFVQLSLEDTGVGMAPDVLARAFEPLYTTKPKGMGTGLGLPQVFAFCERSGGLAAIDSAIGAGTSVHLYLPRALAAPVAERPAPPRPDVVRPQHGLRVLLVEDNDEVAAGTEALLQMMGHQVTCVSDAAGALQRIDATRATGAHDEIGEIAEGSPPPFDLVISDIHMPGTMNGIDLAEAVQQMKPKLPVILVTGYAEELERARNVDVRVLSKPFDIALLERMLEEIRRDQAPGSRPRGNVERDTTL
ncbi:hybrid sensor histidine kinase/response regulator [Paraburkholderia caballeronis]|uniref:histidine kinase n=1 Tax=Paraburkholderia caballeronis TaxID=416943 RepID=A0A1H7VTZ9_9BURK|nr:hybrid sensor histidine kinase/response regulator [Paraburkholderia caballeronis]PXW15467.1 signal transduction histidine kinase [Paraburkholderia caballeronis]PXW93752.1 signal transduction histidine kinase [Paraburkholderia caballeronis]RAJ88992.1 signal transduction histidine kinase [Paraburkholderia caballeronis]SED98442.1 Signal transduction histidine kinase [Paraburkholderia caballeronis]SEM12295.1 Signal transduction histidine kinase [Paraburkholderia caballeronis]